MTNFFFARACGARKMHSLLPPNSIFRGYMNFLLLPENVFLAHESFLGCFSTIIFNTCKIGKMLRAPKARAEIFPPPHLLDRGYAPDQMHDWLQTHTYNYYARNTVKRSGMVAQHRYDQSISDMMNQVQRRRQSYDSIRDDVTAE